MIISTHLPKTAGTSFRISLADHFKSRYRDDYDDQVMVRPWFERSRAAISSGLRIAEQGLDGSDCVHGHFMPVKYLPFGDKRDIAFVTWMREPVARLISHYDYWQQSYDTMTAAPHHRMVVEEGWSLERFCLSEQFRNIYTQYLWGFPLERFAFIGITEHYREDLLEFSRRFLTADLEPRYLNAAKPGSVRSHMDEALLVKVRDFHAADVDLYQHVLQGRQARLNKAHDAAPVKEVSCQVCDA